MDYRSTNTHQHDLDFIRDIAKDLFDPTAWTRMPDGRYIQTEALDPQRFADATNARLGATTPTAPIGAPLAEAVNAILASRIVAAQEARNRTDRSRRQL